MKKSLLLLSFMLFGIILWGQNSLYMTKEFKKAYKNKTRSNSGNPGENYFTNFSDYTINAEFNPESGFLSGNETIIYHNQSSDTLNLIVIRLYQNLFAKGRPRDFAINPNDLTNGVLIKKLTFNEIEINPAEINSYATNMFLSTPEAINPNSTVEIKIEWEINFPQNTTVRNGKYGENVWFIGYWYPQIAVYDDVFGWDINNYSGATEFYNDHSNFDVNITVPAPNILWATGELQNIDEIYTKKFAKRIKDAQISDDVVKIITPEDLTENKILKNKEKNTWHFKALQVPDFSFSTSDKHNWDGVSLLLPNQEKIFISGVYADSTENFHQLAKFTRDIIEVYSFKLPAIPYPYPAMTVFQGGGGMEYPMMVNESATGKLCSDYYVTAHEIGHSYFPFFTGSNETRYAWMDEGLISFFPRLVVDILSPDCNSEKQISTNYKRVANGYTDLPLMVPTSIFKDFWSYRVIAYDRSSFALLQLYNYLGDSLFFAGLQEYTKRWAHKHPYPYDFFYTFEDVTGKDLSWFWKPYFFEFVEANLAITEAKYSKNELNITIENKGGMPLPIYLEITLSDGDIKIFEQNIGCWENSNKYKTNISLENKPIKIQLGKSDIPDIDENDNILNL
ncbi:MAG: M1 family metallopeptidase [Bacteroidales bacterium]|nr:M1 family metallopeptidase [Bacteroidales bacterium]